MTTTAVWGQGVFGAGVYGVGAQGSSAPITYEYTILPAGGHWAITRIRIPVPTNKTIYVKLRLLDNRLKAVDAPYSHYEQSSQNWQVRAYVDTDATPDKMAFEVTANNPGSAITIKYKHSIWNVEISMVAT